MPSTRLLSPLAISRAELSPIAVIATIVPPRNAAPTITHARLDPVTAAITPTACIRKAPVIAFQAPTRRASHSQTRFEGAADAPTTNQTAISHAFHSGRERTITTMKVAVIT